MINRIKSNTSYILDGTELLQLRKPNTSSLPKEVSLSTLAASGIMYNFANTNLTFTGSREHDTNGHYLFITTDNGGYTQSWFTMHPSYFDWGFGGKYFTAQATKTMIYDGNSRFETSSSETIINNGAQNYDTRIEGQTDANLFFTDASADRVFIGQNTGSYKFHVNGSLGSTNAQGDIFFRDNTSSIDFTRAGASYFRGTGAGSSFIFTVNNTGYTNPVLSLSSSLVTINDGAQNTDFRVEGQTDANLFFTDASTDRVGIGTNAPSYKLDVHDANASIRAKSSVGNASFYIDAPTGLDSVLYLTENGVNIWGVHNDSSTGQDFRIYNYARFATDLMIDGATGNIGIGITPTQKLHVYGTSTVYALVQASGTNSPVLALKNATEEWRQFVDASGNYVLRDAGSSTNVITIQNNSTASSIEIQPSTIVFNNGAANLDTRIEGQTDANLFFTDASTDRVGIGTSSPQRKAHIAGGGVNQLLRIENTTAANAFIEFRDSGTTTLPFIGAQNDNFVIYASTRNFYMSSTVTVVNIDNNNHDFRVEGQTDTFNIFSDASTDRVGNGTSSPQEKFHSTGTIRSDVGFNVNGTAGLSGTYTFGGGSTGDIASMTFNGGILTAVTTVP